MEHKKSLLISTTIPITDKIHIKIPSVEEILEDEKYYYGIVSSLTAAPFDYMVQLDAIGIDYTTITDYQLFLMLFEEYKRLDLSIILGDMNTSGFVLTVDTQNNEPILFNPTTNIVIDSTIYCDITDAIRKINMLKKNKYKPANEEARRYLLEKEKRKQKRNAKKPYIPYLENLVVALVNTEEFKYNYDESMHLSIYQFNRSFKQIEHKIAFDKTMIGVYSGTVDTTKLTDKSILSWIKVSEKLQ